MADDRSFTSQFTPQKTMTRSNTSTFNKWKAKKAGTGGWSIGDQDQMRKEQRDGLWGEQPATTGRTFSTAHNLDPRLQAFQDNYKNEILKNTATGNFSQYEPQVGDPDPSTYYGAKTPYDPIRPDTISPITNNGNLGGGNLFTDLSYDEQKQDNRVQLELDRFPDLTLDMAISNVAQRENILRAGGTSAGANLGSQAFKEGLVDIPQFDLGGERNLGEQPDNIATPDRTLDDETATLDEAPRTLDERENATNAATSSATASDVASGTLTGSSQPITDQTLTGQDNQLFPGVEQYLPEARSILGIDERPREIDTGITEREALARDAVSSSFERDIRSEEALGRQKEQGMKGILGSTSGRNLNTFGEDSLNRLRDDSAMRVSALENRRQEAVRTFDFEEKKRIETKIDKEEERQVQARNSLLSLIFDRMAQQESSAAAKEKAGADAQQQSFENLIELEELGIKSAESESLVGDRQAKQDLAMNKFGLSMEQFEQANGKIEFDQAIALDKFNEDTRRYDQDTALDNLKNAGFSVDQEGNIVPTLNRLKEEFDQAVATAKLPFELQKLKLDVANKQRLLSKGSGSSTKSIKDFFSNKPDKYKKLVDYRLDELRTFNPNTIEEYEQDYSSWIANNKPAAPDSYNSDNELSYTNSQKQKLRQAHLDNASEQEKLDFLIQDDSSSSGTILLEDLIPVKD